MGHVVNPINFRLTKTKFPFNTWISTSKIRFSPLLINDITLTKFIKWYLSSSDKFLLKQNLLINNFKIISNFSVININLNFAEILDYKKPLKKKKFINNKSKKTNLLTKTNSLLFFYLYKKRYISAKNSQNSLIQKNNIYYFSKLLFFLNNYKHHLKFNFKNVKINYFFYKHSFWKIYKNNEIFLKKKKLAKKPKPQKQFLTIFRKKLTTILNVFFKKFSNQFLINIFLLKNIQYSNILTQFVQTKLNQGFMLQYLITKLNYKLKSSLNNSIIGYKLYYSGRSSKKLRNFSVVWSDGFLGLSNTAVPLDYTQAALWTKKGIVGLKIWLLKKTKQNEIF